MTIFFIEKIVILLKWGRNDVFEPVYSLFNWKIIDFNMQIPIFYNDFLPCKFMYIQFV